MILYAFYTIVSLSLSYAVYFFILKNQKTFQFNRLYLLLSLMLCLVAPVLEIELFKAIPKIRDVGFKSSAIINSSQGFIEEGLIVAADESWLSIHNLIWYLYLAVTLFFMLRFAKNLWSILRLTRRPQERLGNMIKVEIDDDEQVSSFFRYIFVSSKQLKHDGFAKAVIAHEHVHYKQLHSSDLFLIEFLICFFWFNPFLFLYKKAIIQNHEFVADNQAIHSGIDLRTYAKAIIGLDHKEYRVPLTSGFNFIQIKNRIIMLHQPQTPILKRALNIITALLLFSGIFLFSAFKDVKAPLIVVIDAGHGGHDMGNSNEKEVVLQISNMLADLGDDKIKIIQTRTGDNFLTLKKRAEFVNKQNPDLFISLHCNSSDNTDASGVEIFSSNKGSNEKLSLGYGWLLLNQQLENKVATQGKMKTAEFYLLQQIDCPRLVMELGFLSNQNDRERLNNMEHQKDVAKALYDGLLEIREKKALISMLDKD